MTGYTRKVGLKQPAPHAWDGCAVCALYITKRYGSTAAYKRSLNHMAA